MIWTTCTLRSGLVVLLAMIVRTNQMKETINTRAKTPAAMRRSKRRWVRLAATGTRYLTIRWVTNPSCVISSLPITSSTSITR